MHSVIFKSVRFSPSSRRSTSELVLYGFTRISRYTTERFFSYATAERCSSIPNTKNNKKIVLFGLGLHAQRIYYPLIAQYAIQLNIELSLVVDLQSKKYSIDKYLAHQDIQPNEIVYLADRLNEPGAPYLHEENYKYLSDLMGLHGIDGAIIATEPLVHKMYAHFCLDHGISILMDKPITARKNVISSLESARGLLDDYIDLKEAYIKAKTLQPSLTFSIQTQRRFHPAYLKLQELVEEISERVNIPITSCHSYHCDGEWRTPFEISDQHYHSYNEGFGKLSHSGYHCLDILVHLVKASYSKCKDKNFDSIDVDAALLTPMDILEQFTEDDYKGLFGEDVYNKRNQYNGRFEELSHNLKKCGEVDAFVRIKFQQNDHVMTMGTLNLQHNGYSNRAWLNNDNRNLYKGNGRVRHESHVIQQGPFQSLHLHSYQSKFDPTESDDRRYDMGGVDHLDVVIYRNPLVTTSSVGTFKRISIKEIDTEFLSGYSHGHQENSRANGFFEFVDNLHGNICDHKCNRSDLLSHEVSVGLLSAIYESHCLNKVVTYEHFCK